MTQPRNRQVSLEATSYYHCICRCVRRAFLCGVDYASGNDYSHRRNWVVERLAVLTDAFAIDLYAYAVMSNHYHVVVRVDTDRAAMWSYREVAERWLRLFSGPILVRRWLEGEVLTTTDENTIDSIIAVWRYRLADLSWFMKCLNEHIARRANAEDGCTGRFWESRFRSQALLDEKAVLAVMAYVDLNPIRAGIADTPETCAYTSIQQRTSTISNTSSADSVPRRGTHYPRLAPLTTGTCSAVEVTGRIDGIQLVDYLELVDWTGRRIRTGGSGFIGADRPPILDRLKINERAWLNHMRPRHGRMLAAIGALHTIQHYVLATGRRWLANRHDAACLASS